MPFMLRMSLQILPLTVYSPELWAAVALVVALAIVRRRRITNSGNRANLLELFALVPIPIVILAWGLYFWPIGLGARGPHEGIALIGVQVLAAIELLVAGRLIWRQPLHFELATGLACIALVWTEGALFVATMAITNTWL